MALQKLESHIAKEQERCQFRNFVLCLAGAPKNGPLTGFCRYHEAQLELFKVKQDLSFKTYDVYLLPFIFQCVAHSVSQRIIQQTCDCYTRGQ